MRKRNTIELLEETIYHPNFNYTEFGTIKNSAESNNSVFSAKNWIEATNAIGVTAKTGRHGGSRLAKYYPIWLQCQGMAVN